MKALLLSLILLLASCGGGGGTSAPTSPTTPAPLRSGIVVGYYFGCLTNMVEQVSHVNMWWATGFCGGSGSWFLDMAQEMQAARAAGIKNIVLAAYPSMVNGPNANAEMEFQLVHLIATGQMVGWDSIMVYPQDEPDRNGFTDAQMIAIVNNLHAIFQKYPELHDAKVGVIYNCSSPVKPGISAVDRVGCDDYGKGCGALSEIDQIKLLPGQLLMVVPSGADDYRNDPQCFLDYAERNVKVWAVVPFLWQTADGHRGIRENGMKGLYCAMGQTILHPGAPQTCG